MALRFAGLAGLLFFVLLVWAGATVYRLYNPEHPHPFEEHPVVRRERTTARGRRIAVGVREIRADRRREQRRRDARSGYVWGRSDGIPGGWHEDLGARRN